jgi:hypothetical protein
MAMQYLIEAYNTMILSVVLHGCTTFSLMLKEEQRIGLCWTGEEASRRKPEKFHKEEFFAPLQKY